MHAAAQLNEMLKEKSSNKTTQTTTRLLNIIMLNPNDVSSGSESDQTLKKKQQGED